MSTKINEIRNFSNGVVNSIEASVAIGKQRLGIHTFGYRRFLSNGKSFGFSDNTCLEQIFLQHFAGVRIPEYEKDFNKFIVSGENYIMRKGVLRGGSPYFKTLYENDIWNTLVVYIKNPENFLVEAFFLSATRDAVHMAEVYRENLTFIQQWITSIQPQLAECFTRKTDTYFSTTLVNPLCLKNLQNFLYSEQIIKGLRSLSLRERKVAFLLIKGCKRRDIAFKLNIKPKTVDANIEHIKHKTCTFSKEQVLRLLEGFGEKEMLKFYEM